MNTDMTQIFIQLGVLFFIMATGYVLKATKRVDNSFEKLLSKVVLQVTLPCMILASVLSAETIPDPRSILVTFGFAILTYVVLVVIAEVCTRLLFLPKTHRGVYRFMGVFGNVGFIGFPVISAIFGDGALIYAAMFNIPFNLLVFTLGAFWLSNDVVEGDIDIHRPKPKFSPRILLSPAVVSCAAVIVLVLLGVHQVPVISQACSTIGSMTTPAALLIIGSNLANLPLRDLAGSVRIWVSAFFRLIVSPLVVWGIFHFFVSDPVLLGVMVIISSMPVATNGTLLCFQYGGDLKAMSQGTFITTLLSFAVIPLLVLFLSVVG